MQNNNTEKGFLAGIIISAETGKPALSNFLSNGLDDSWFAKKTNKDIFKAILSCESEKSGSYTLNRIAGKLIDLKLNVTGDELMSTKMSEVSAAWIDVHFENLRKSYICREQATSISAFVDKNVKDGYSIEEFPNQIEELIEKVRKTSSKGQSEKDATLLDAVNNYKDSLSAKSKDSLVKTHIWDLNDALSGGFRPNQLIVCCGRPGMGKSAFAMEICEHGCGLEGSGIYYSLEMSLQDFGERLAHRFEKDMNELDFYARGNGMILRTKGQWTIEKIRNDAISTRDRILDEGKKLKLIAIDHIGLVAPSMGQHKRTREQEVAHISRNLKMLAGELEVPVIAVSQLNRGVEFRNEKGPVLSDLRDSGAIEQDADVVLGLHRPSYYDESMKHFVDEIRCLKVRQGRTGTIPAKFVSDRVCWRSV